MLEITPITRIVVSIDVAGLLADKAPAVIAGVDVAFVEPGAAPVGTTAWMTSTYSAGTAHVMVAGYDADPTGALVCPPGNGANLWILVTDAVTGEVIPKMVMRVEAKRGPSGAETVVSGTPFVTSVAGLTGIVSGPALMTGLGSALTNAIDAEIATHVTPVADATTTAKGVVRLAGDLGGTAAAPTVPGLAGKLAAASNLSDVASAATARTNLGLGTAATQPTTAFDAAGAATAAQGASLQKTSNLSDLASAATARTNLGAPSSTAVTASLGANPRALGAVWAFQGDSITGLWFPAFAGILAKQRIAYRQSLVFSHSGYTSTQLAAITSEVITATPTPQVVFLQMGANDAIGGVSVATFSTNITNIAAAYRAAGIIPVIGTVLPQQNASFRPRIRQYNAWLKEFCAAQQITLVDLYSALVDHTTGAPATGMLNVSDGLHPVSAGSRAMGAAIASAVDPLLPVVAPTVAVDAADATNMFGTSGFATADTNADGIPDGWTATGAATGWTHSLVTDTSANGRWLRMVGSGAGAQRTLVPNDLSAGFAVGDKMRLTCRARCSGQTATNSEMSVFVQVYSAGYAAVVMDSTYAVPALTAAVDGIASLQFTIPASGAIIGTFFAAGPGNGTYEIADVTMTNLTALGF